MMFNCKKLTTLLMYLSQCHLCGLLFHKQAWMLDCTFARLLLISLFYQILTWLMTLTMISLEMTVNLFSMHYENGALEVIHLVKLHRGNKVVIPWLESAPCKNLFCLCISEGWPGTSPASGIDRLVHLLLSVACYVTHPHFHLFWRVLPACRSSDSVSFTPSITMPSDYWSFAKVRKF